MNKIFTRTGYNHYLGADMHRRLITAMFGEFPCETITYGQALDMIAERGYYFSMSIGYDSDHQRYVWDWYFTRTLDKITYYSQEHTWKDAANAVIEEAILAIQNQQ